MPRDCVGPLAERSKPLVVGKTRQRQIDDDFAGSGRQHGRDGEVAPQPLARFVACPVDKGLAVAVLAAA